MNDKPDTACDPSEVPMKDSVVKEVMYRNPLHKGDLRNKKCICMSGKKVKKCHGAKAHITIQENNAINRLITKYNKDLEDHLKKEGEIHGS